MGIMEHKTKEKKKLRLGEMLLEYGIITREQLTLALKSQAQAGGYIGSILEDLGFLNESSLLDFLSKQFNVPSVNLFETTISHEILQCLPFEKIKELKALPIKRTGDKKIVFAMVNPHNIAAIDEIEFAYGVSVEPVVTPFFQMQKVISHFEKEGYGTETFEGEKLRPKIISSATEVPDIYALLELTLDHNATDIHITAGVPPSLKIDNELQRLPMPSISPELMKEFTDEILTREQKKIFERDKEIDFALSLEGKGRFRVNIYRQRNSISFAARYVIEDVPSLEGLGLPMDLANIALKTQGFVLITGPSGHGKTTTMSALIDVINSNRRCNIITLEDPIEYLHRHKKSNINQREVGVDTESFSVGLKHVFRQDPDVIVIGEMRDPESIAIALTAAETGHLVISTLHSLNATSAVDRIIDIFPGHQQHQVKLQFASVFLLVFGQRLVPRKGSSGRVLAYEKMANTFRIRNMIREGKTHNIRSLMQAVSEDFHSIDRSLANLCIEEKITLEDGLKYADNVEFYEDMVKLGNKNLKS